MGRLSKTNAAKPWHDQYIGDIGVQNSPRFKTPTGVHAVNAYIYAILDSKTPTRPVDTF